MDKLEGLLFYKECEYREIVCALWLNIALRGVMIGDFF